MFHFAHDEAGRLRAESVPLDQIAEQVGTPTYVYARATLERHFNVFTSAFAGHPHLVCYSIKANSNGAVLKVLGARGSGDIVSGGELARSLRAGIPGERIVFSGVGKTKEEMRAALAANILLFNIESEPELETLAEVAQELGRIAPVALRVNPAVDPQTHPYIATGLAESKFGVPIEEARRIADDVVKSRSLSLRGIDCHIGSQLTSLDPLLEALDSVIELVDALKADGHEINYIDLGGGLGIPYRGTVAARSAPPPRPHRGTVAARSAPPPRPHRGTVAARSAPPPRPHRGTVAEEPPHPEVFGRAVVDRMAGRSECLILEPGRVIVGNAGLLLTRVLYVKRAPRRTFVVLDAAMNDLLRPSLYRAHHEIWPVHLRPGAESPVDFVGPICESGDTFAEQRMFQPVEAGDLVTVMSAGAYGFTMSSTYNSRPRAAEVLVSADRCSVVRQRESAEALTKGESFPEWL